MIISEEKITEYQKIYKKLYGKDISRQDAYEQGMKLVQMMKVIYHPMTEEEYENVQKSMLNHFVKEMREYGEKLKKSQS